MGVGGARQAGKGYPEDPRAAQGGGEGLGFRIVSPQGESAEEAIAGRRWGGLAMG